MIGFSTRIPSFETILAGDSLDIPSYNQIAIIPGTNGSATIVNSVGESITISAPLVFGSNMGGFENWATITVSAVTEDVKLIINGDIKISGGGSGGSASVAWGTITGDPTLQADLQNGTIQGIFTPSNNAIVTGDTFKQAFQKTQGQLNTIPAFTGASNGQMLQYQSNAWTKTTILKDTGNTNSIDVSNRLLLSPTQVELMNWSANDYIQLKIGLAFYDASNVWRLNQYINAGMNVVLDTNNSDILLTRSGDSLVTYRSSDILFYKTIYAGTASNAGIFLDRGNQGERVGIFVGNGTTYAADEAYFTSNNSGTHFLTGPGLSHSFDFNQNGSFSISTGLISDSSNTSLNINLRTLNASSGSAIIDWSSTTTGAIYTSDFSGGYVARSLVDRNYVDNLITGITWKNSVVAGTTANITLSGTQTIDGIAVIVGDRVLVKNQSTATQNGLYLCASGAWTRTLDADTGSEIAQSTVLVEGGTVNGGTQWNCSNTTITVGVTNITFVQIAGAGVYTNGTGLSLIGNVFSINTGYVGQTSITTLGTITTGTWSGTTIGINKGGTNSTSQVANGVTYYDGTSIKSLATFLFDGTNLGVGATPQSVLTIAGQPTIQTPISGTTAHFSGVDGSPLRVTFDTYNNASSSGTALMFRRSRGTGASPSAVSSGDDLGSFNVRGYGASAYAASSTGLLSFKANQAFTNANMGTYASIYTTPDNSVTATEALRITGAGEVNAIQAGGVYQINSVTLLTSSSLTIPTVFGSASASGNLQLTSTSNGTKGFVYTGANMAHDGTKGFLGIGTLTPASLLHLSGNISASSWTTNGIALRIDAATYTNTTSTGTVATIYTSVFGAPTYNSSSSTTYTDLFNVYIKAGIAGTLTTITNNYAVGIEGDVSLLGGNRTIKASNGLTIALTSGQAYAVTLSGSTKYGISAGGNHTFLSTSQASGTTPFMTFTQSANTGGSCPVMLITAGASTSQTTATEVIDINYNLSAVLKSVDGTIATQRTFLIQPRTYTPQTTALTITTAVTFDVSSSIAGSGTTITNNYAIRSTGNINLLGNIVTDTTTGIKIGTATGQKLGFWNATPVIQQTTGIAAGAFVANTSGTVNDSATYGGYTIGQIAAALRLLGILA